MNELAVGQVWHFFCYDVPDCDDYYLLLRPLVSSSLDGLWEVFDILNCEISWVCPCVAGEWVLME